MNEKMIRKYCLSYCLSRITFLEKSKRGGQGLKIYMYLLRNITKLNRINSILSGNKMKWMIVDKIK